MRNLIRLLTISVSLYSGMAFSIDCPPMPSAITQVDHDVKMDINAAAGSLGKIKAGELDIKTEIFAKNLFSKYPNADKLFSLQTLASSYCSMLNSAMDMTDSEKINRWEKFQDKVLNLQSEPVSKNTDPPAPEENKKLAIASKIGIGEFNQSSDSLANDNISAKLSKDETTQQKYVSYELSALGTYWKVRQLIDSDKKLKDAWLQQYSKVIWYQGNDKPDFDSIKAPCSQTNTDRIQSRLVNLIGQPDDVVDRKYWTDDLVDNGYTLETDHVVGGASWNFKDGSRLRFIYQNLHKNQNKSQAPYSFTISESCSINICIHPEKVNKNCPKIDGLSL